MFRILICLFSFLFIPAMTLACSCFGYAGNLNLALSKADNIVLVKVEEFKGHGAKLSVQQEFKGKTGKKTIMAWGDPGNLCRDSIPKEYLGQQVVVLLNKIERTYEGLSGKEEKVGDFEHITCGLTTYNVATNKEGVLVVKGDLRTKNGSDELKFDDLQKWIDNPKEPAKILANAKIEALMKNPHIACAVIALAYVKKGDKKRAFTTFRPSDSPSDLYGTSVHKESRHDEETFKMDLHDYSWRSTMDFVETSERDKKTIKEWIKTHRPIFQVSIDLKRQENGPQHLESQTTFVVGKRATPLYRHTISVPLESFKDKILKGPETSSILWKKKRPYRPRPTPTLIFLILSQWLMVIFWRFPVIKYAT